MEVVSSFPEDHLVDNSVALAAELLTAARARTSRRERRRQLRLRRLLASESGTRLVFSLADRVLRPPDARTAAVQLAALTAGPLESVSPTDRTLLRLAAAAARPVPGPVVALVAARLRHETGSLVYPAEPAALGRRLYPTSPAGRRPNLNVLGEAILGWQEAERRTAAVEALLRRPDVDCVSVKVSSVAAGLSLIDFEGSVERVAGPLRRLYRSASAQPDATLVTSDMEEHRDLDLTVESFIRVLDDDEFASLTAGIALPGLSPGHPRCRGPASRLGRRPSGGGPGPVSASAWSKGRTWPWRRWTPSSTAGRPRPTPPRPTPTRPMSGSWNGWWRPPPRGPIAVGVASHNLFDVALALVLAQQAGAPVDIEMLAGMADSQAAAVAERSGRVLLYVPATARRDFLNALAYLARRLDENTTPEGFLSHILDMVPGSPDWEEQAERFARSVQARRQVTTRRFQTQTRSPDPSPPTADRPAPGAAFRNEPDTDLTVAANRRWASATLQRETRSPPAPASRADIDLAVARAVEAGREWGATPAGERRRLLSAAAEVMAAGRTEAVAVMTSEAGKTFAEADPEVSEAVDYARWYAAGTGLLAYLEGEVASVACGVVVVAPPWNFPYAIAAGGVLAALAAGNTVILKPSPEAPITAAFLVEQLHERGPGRGSGPTAGRR